MVVIQLLQVAYSVADTIWLGRLPADAVDAADPAGRGAVEVGSDRD